MSNREGAFMNYRVQKQRNLALMMIIITPIIFTVSAISALAAENDSSAALNNLANLYVVNSHQNPAKLDSALLLYNKALKITPDDAGIYLNIGIVWLIKGDEAMAEKYFIDGFERCQNDHKLVYNLLGMDYKPVVEDKGTVGNVSEVKLRKKLGDSLDKIKPTKKKKGRNSEQESKDQNGGKKKKKKVVRSAGDKSLNPQELKDYLYWKI